MSPLWTWLVSGLCAVVAMTLVVLWWRRRTLLHTPGTFPSRFFANSSQKKGASFVVSYNETSVELLTMYSVSPVPRFSIPRHRLEIDRVGEGRRDDWVRVRLYGDVQPITLEMHQDHCSELSTWLEAGPAIGIGVWREAPVRRQRRRFF